MGWVESLQKAIDYMEENLLEPIGIDEIAKQASVSAFHFQRIFAVLTDSSIAEYIRRRRLTLAAEELSRTDHKIIDVAFKYGYETPEAFTKAFRRQHGMAPSQAREGSGNFTMYQRLVIQVNLKGADPMKVRMVERDGFQIAGVKREFSMLNGENLAGIPKMWDEMNGNGTDDLLFGLNNGEIKGVLGVCVDKSSDKEQLMDYWIAAEYEGEAPDGLLTSSIPASKWAVFEVVGPMPNAMQDMWKRIYEEWFPSSGYSIASTPALEVYSYGNIDAREYYSEIWIPIK